ncbi:MAG: FkbM family methyltransferase, partial [bacterium]
NDNLSWHLSEKDTERKRLFKRRWSKRRIRHSFNELMKEQDPQSPHRYLSDHFRIEDGDVLVDVGVAEGNFALGAVEKVSRLILFEADKEWIEALKATFEPWKNKVVIVNKFVSDVTNATHTTLDDYLVPGERISFLKIDVDGAESRLLDGCKRVLAEQRPLKLAVCTYHRQNDEQEFEALLSRNGFEISHSDGFMLFYHDKKIDAPYFRRGLIRAVKHA